VTTALPKIFSFLTDLQEMHILLEFPFFGTINIATWQPHEGFSFYSEGIILKKNTFLGASVI
jgi:hypothetical protein